MSLFRRWRWESSPQPPPRTCRTPDDARDMRRQDAARAFVALFALACVLSPAASLEDRRARASRTWTTPGEPLGPGSRRTRPRREERAGPIQVGFPRARAEAALRAVGNDDCCAPQMKYLFEETKRKAANTADAPKSSECHMRPNTVPTASPSSGAAPTSRTRGRRAASRARTTCRRGDGYPCNVWVYCPEEGGCFAPAAGDFVHKQCWLKWQEEPENPREYAGRVLGRIQSHAPDRAGAGAVDRGERCPARHRSEQRNVVQQKSLEVTARREARREKLEIQTKSVFARASRESLEPNPRRSYDGRDDSTCVCRSMEPLRHTHHLRHAHVAMVLHSALVSFSGGFSPPPRRSRRHPPDLPDAS